MRAPRWLPYAGIAAFYIALLVVVQIAMEPIVEQQVGTTPRGAIVRRWSLLSGRLAMENERLREMVIRDSLQKTLPPTPGLYLSLPPYVDAAHVRTLLQREAGVSPKAVISVAAIPFTFGAHQGVRDGLWRRMHLSGTQNGLPYCTVVVPVSPSQNREEHYEGTRPSFSRFTRPGLLGPCAVWSRHGPPGPLIQQWLDAGGSHFTQTDNAYYGIWDQILDRRSDREAPSDIRLALPVQGQACLAGRRAKCESGVLHPKPMATDLESFYAGRGNWPTQLAGGEERMLATLERDFGAERFQRFWTSSKPLEQAFEEAFGIPLGEWVYEWLEPVGHFTAGARMDAASLLLTLLLLGAVSGLVLATAEKRRI